MGGPAGEDENGDRVLKALAREKVNCSACQRIDGLATALSAIFMNARGDRTIVTYRDERIATAAPHDPERAVSGVDAVLADNAGAVGGSISGGGTTAPASSQQAKRPSALPENIFLSKR